MLQKTIKEMKPDPAFVANYPEMLPMMGGRQVRDMVVPESLPYANPLHLILTAEDQLLSKNEPMLVGEGVFDDLGKSVTKGVKSVGKVATKATKSAKKGLKKDIAKVEKVAKDIAKSKTGKAIGSAAKKTASVSLDIAEKSAGALGGLAGAAAAVALANPELAPAASAIGSAAANELAKRARKGIKKSTGLGQTRPPSAWITHVKSFSKVNNISYKDALKKARDSYKK